MNKYTNIGKYTDEELLELAMQQNGFKYVPKNWWILGFRSKEDAPNTYDDKFYIFFNKECKYVLTGTTNAGTWGLLNFKSYGVNGTAHIKGNEWYYHVWSRGLHRKKVEALVQTGTFKVVRDNDKDLKSGNSGKVYEQKWKGLNFHPNSYNLRSTIVRWFIGKWSLGCQVTNEVTKYADFIEKSRPQRTFSYCLIEEK